MMMKRRTIGLALLLLSASACTGARPQRSIAPEGPLADCPASPNCVSSDESRETHRTAPIRLAVPAAEAWPIVVEVVAGLPRTHIVTRTSTYLHAECTSALFRYVDDLELQMRPRQGLVAIRSASRLGYGDMGVNAARVEAVRAALIERGVARSQ